MLLRIDLNKNKLISDPALAMIEEEVVSAPWTSEDGDKGFVRLDECIFKKCCKKYKKKGKKPCKSCPKR